MEIRFPDCVICRVRKFAIWRGTPVGRHWAYGSMYFLMFSSRCSRAQGKYGTRPSAGSTITDTAGPNPPGEESPGKSSMF